MKEDISLIGTHSRGSKRGVAVKKFVPILATALCIAIGMFALTGCSPSSGSSGSSDSGSTSSVFNYDATIEKTTLVDNDVVSVVAESLSYENNQAVLNLSITNKSGGNISVGSSTLSFPANSINSYMVPGGWFSEDIPAGETVSVEANYSIDELRIYGIKAINEIGVGISVADDDYETLYQDVTTLTTSLGGSYSDSSFNDAINDPSIQSSLGATVKNTSTNLGTLTYNGLHFNAAYLVKNSDGEYALMFEVENTTDIPMYIKSEGLLVNGEDLGSYFGGIYLESGKKRVDSIDLSYYLESAEKSDIQDSINEVCFTYSILDENGNTIAGDNQAKFAF